MTKILLIQTQVIFKSKHTYKRKRETEKENVSGGEITKSWNHLKFSKAVELRSLMFPSLKL